MAEDSFTGKERELSRALVPGTNTIPQILPPPQRIGASSLNQVHRQHCNISDFSETHKTRRCSCINQSTSHLQAPHSLQSCHRRSTFVAPPLDLLLRRHTPGTPGQGSSLRTFWVHKWIICCFELPLQAPGCEQQAGKAVWSTMHSSPRHSRPLAY